MSEPQCKQHNPSDEELDLIEVAIALAKNKRTIFGLPLLAAVFAAVYAMSMPNIFTSSTKILPPQSQSATAGMLAQLGGLISLGGSSVGLKNPSDLYVGILKSRTISDSIIDRFNLDAAFNQKVRSRTRALLNGMTNIKADKDGIILIEVDDTDPVRSAFLANAYVEELQTLSSTLAITEASQRRLFFERQLVLAKENLAQAESSAKQALDKGGITHVEGQGRSMLELAARLRAEVTVKEIQLGAMRNFAAERNPELLRAQQELESTKQELAKIEGVGRAKRLGVASDSSQVAGSLRLLQEVKYRETLYELLTRQYELAKIDEAKNTSIIQVLDKALPPDEKSKPNRVRLVAWTTIAAFALGVIWALLREFSMGVRTNASRAKQLDVLRGYLWGK